MPLVNDPKEVARRRLVLATPHRLSMLLTDCLGTLRGEQVDGHLTSIDVRQVIHAHERSDSDERATIRKNIPPRVAEEIARNFASGLNLIEISDESDPFVRPMLIYYGCAQFLGAFSRALLDWKGDALSHGLGCVYGGSPENTAVKIESRGFFRRVANTMAIMQGQYNLFSARDSSGVPIVGSNHVFGSVPAILLPRRVTLEDLVTHNPARIAPGAPVSVVDAERHGSEAYNPIATDMLIDLLIVFVAGSLCRYNPVVWRKVMEGRETSIGLEVSGALTRASTTLIDSIVFWLCHCNTTNWAFDTNPPTRGSTNPYGVLGRRPTGYPRY